MDLKQKLNKILKLESYALNLGFDKTCLVLSRSILVDERVRIQCQVNICGNFNNNLMCPPHLPTLSEVRNLINKYSFALLLQLHKSFAPNTEEESRIIFTKIALQMNEMLVSLERTAFSSGFPLALALGAGECKLCENCVVKDGIIQCRKPGFSRPSMEGMGIDVMQTFQSAGLSVEFIKGELTIAGLLLID